jgi:hypothetical protein
MITEQMIFGKIVEQKNTEKMITEISNMEVAK